MIWSKQKRREELALAEQAQGLRFDIFERVHLSEEVEGIEQLEEIELLPHIQVVSQGDQAVLKGHLMLSGAFAGGENRSGGALEHSIPVEITLPMNRIPNLNEIGVEIENFDIDMVSPRTLNVTGVLSLNGIEVLTTSGDWKEGDSAEEVFSAETASTREEKEETSVTASREAREEQTVEPVAEVVEEAAEEVVEEAAEAALPENPELANPEPVLEAVEEAVEEAVPEKKEMKIAFGSKRREEESETVEVKSLAGKAEATRGATSKAAAAKAAKAQAEAAEEETRSAGEAVEWKSLFLSRDSEEQQFSSVRMCIVQKEETIDSIAERYSLHPSEITLYNRLNDPTVREGQIIYIPR